MLKAIIYSNHIEVDRQEGRTRGSLFKYCQAHFGHCLRSTEGGGWIFAHCPEGCDLYEAEVLLVEIHGEDK